MKFKTMIAAVAAMTMSATPVLAAATPSTLSTSHARAAAPTGHANALGGGGAGIYALLMLAGIAAIVIVDATKDDNDRPASR